LADARTSRLREAATLNSLLGGIGEAFADRNFRYYSVAAIVSWLSFFVQAVAVSWTAWELTHSTRWLAGVALADAAPNIILMPLGGVLADRHDRFRLQRVAYALATLQAAALTGLALAGSLTILPLAALAFAHGAIHAFSIPAQYGFMPRFIAPRRLPSAIAVAAAYTQLGLFIGPALAGWMIFHFGAAAAFASNVAGYLIYFAFIAMMRTPEGYVQPAARGKSFAHDFLEGLAAIARHRGIAVMLPLMLCAEALGAATRQMAPAFADMVSGSGVEGLSTLLACGGAGATLSALWLAHGGARRTSPVYVLWGLLGFLAGGGGVSASHGLVAAGVAMAVMGAGFEIGRTGWVALLQISVGESVRGRVMSTQFLLLRLAGALGTAAVGGGGALFGLRSSTLVGVTLALTVWLWTLRGRGRIRAAFAVPSR
jgi:MFS family permease